MRQDFNINSTAKWSFLDDMFDRFERNDNQQNDARQSQLKLKESSKSKQ